MNQINALNVLKKLDCLVSNALVTLLFVNYTDYQKSMNVNTILVKLLEKSW